ncbi:hypothetical protein PLESTB_001557500 [Pleodorina starrii]|uniref:tRNA-binding domain-containing protein n=1 Tax=Pleodorina starrii TaxID=330485 RepID=A0A9W6F834_9CHLO|nr:hypothetical protein PLESTM_001473500 [Pleodorina starrii]GLC59952.1 hypothetical protein PLESTB_001557500 [Pleodorina starrii]GLC72819.1 hypothetical protein PLESTF_001296600 [Pleodorina starrii]
MASQLNTVRRSAGARQSRRDNVLPFTPYRLASTARDSSTPGTTPYAQAVFALRLQEQRFQRSICKAAAQTAEAAPAPAASEAAAAPDADPATMDIRVGKIVKCEQHPDADSLYVEQIDVGEPEPRTIVSGLVKFVPLEAMQDRKVIVLCNLKPRNMRGIKSNGMVLCASNDAHDVVEPLAPPAEAPVGERVYFGEEGKNQAAPAEPNRVQKKKYWEAVQPLLKTDGEATARFRDAVMLTSAGPVRAASLTNANIA